MGIGENHVVSKRGKQRRAVGNHGVLFNRLRVIYGDRVRYINFKNTNSVQEQADAFASAQVIISPQGTSECNGLFMRPGSAMISIVATCGLDNEPSFANAGVDYELVPIELRYLWEFISPFNAIASEGEQHYFNYGTCSFKRQPGLWIIRVVLNQSQQVEICAPLSKFQSIT
mmetsp:Transcript_38290/g.95000  ORF Transcript_38290/g.95000 Transcript_38290/m.95000 type:complete len:172 (-) Transcript_38290:970-1485(-)